MVHILLISYTLLHGITKMDISILSKLMYSQQTNKNSQKTHSSSPVQCSIPVVHSTVCTHPAEATPGPISLTLWISDKIGKEPARCYIASLDNSHAFVVLPLVQQCMYKVTNADTVFKATYMVQACLPESILHGILCWLLCMQS